MEDDDAMVVNGHACDAINNLERYQLVCFLNKGFFFSLYCLHPFAIYWVQPIDICCLYLSSKWDTKWYAEGNCWERKNPRIKKFNINANRWFFFQLKNLKQLYNWSDMSHRYELICLRAGAITDHFVTLTSSRILREKKKIPHQENFPDYITSHQQQSRAVGTWYDSGVP